MIKTLEQKIAFCKKHYNYAKDFVDRIDAGEEIPTETITEMTMGQRNAFVNEVNIAVDRLAELGNFDLKKIR